VVVDLLGFEVKRFHFSLAYSDLAARMGMSGSVIQTLGAVRSNLRLEAVNTLSNLREEN
jgi:hypothetical protein